VQGIRSTGAWTCQHATSQIATAASFEKCVLVRMRLQWFWGGLVFKSHRLCCAQQWLQFRLDHSPQPDLALVRGIPAPPPPPPLSLAPNRPFPTSGFLAGSGNFGPASREMAQLPGRIWSNPRAGGIQGYLAYKKTPYPLGPPQHLRRRPTVGS
jgi:hypothetical protein